MDERPHEPSAAVPGRRVASSGDLVPEAPQWFDGMDQGSAVQVHAYDQMTAAEPTHDPGDEDLDLLDPGWSPSRKVSWLTGLLAAGIVVALSFAGGAIVQKQHDAALGGGNRLGAAARNGRTGTGPGGASGFGGLGGAGGFGSQAGTGSAPGGGSGSTSLGTPVVVGTVVSVSSGGLVVKNFAGAMVTVHVGVGVPVTTSGLGGLKAGASVSVTGTKAGDGSVTATSVTSRKAG